MKETDIDVIFLLTSFAFCSAGGSHRQCSCNPQKYRLFICFFSPVNCERIGWDSVADPGERPGEPALPYFWTKLRPEGPKKNSFGGRGPSYRKIWIRHWDLGYVKKEPDEFSTSWKLSPDTKQFNIFALLTRNTRSSLRILIIFSCFSIYPCAEHSFIWNSVWRLPAELKRIHATTPLLHKNLDG